MSIFKEPFNEEITKTLSTRQELMGKQTRTPQELSFLNSNTTWVSLKSAINVDGDEGNLAKQNVLEGGSLIDGKLRYGVNATGSYSFQNSKGEKNELGIRPMPGIISVNIENIGAYGSTRKATINYQCWDVKQLDILEQLYMRPGYLVLLEFGRTTYLEKDSQGVSKLKQVVPNYNFFDSKKVNINLLDELKELYAKSIESKGNYDAFLGYVTNYGWQIRPDGGYDCKTEIISTGEVLESLKTNYSLATNVDFQNIEEGNSTFKGLLLPSFTQTQISGSDLKKINEDYSANILLGIIGEIYLLGKYDQIQKLLPAPTTPGVFSVNVKGKQIDLHLARSIHSSTNEQYYKLSNSSNLNYYITLESFFDLLNELVIPHSVDDNGNSKGSLTKLSVYDRGYLNKDKESLKCLYNILMTSVDPDICLIRNDVWSDILQNLDITVNLSPINVVPKGYETILNNPDARELRKNMPDWLTRISKNEVSAIDHITKNIHEDYKNWKGRNPGKSDTEYFKFFQQVYQTVRGGLNPETRTPKTIAVNGQLLESETDFNVSKPIRSWNYLRGNDALVNTLRNQFKTTEDLKFINLVRGRYPGILTPEQKFVINQLNNTTNDTNLDNALNAQQSTVNEALQNAKKAEETKKTITEVGDNYKRFLANIPLSFPVEINKRKFGEIKNIYINVKYLYNLANDPNLKTQDPSGKNSLMLSQLITTMIKEVQASIGNVNDFELHIDDRDGIGRIIDLNYVNKEKENFTFEIGTNKSIIRNLKLESKIFSDQVSMIAISAQGDSGKLGLDNSTLVAFNKGITDRLIPKKDSPSVNDQRKETNNLLSSLSNLTSQFFSPYMKGYWDKNIGGKFDYGNAPSFKDYLRDIIVFFTDRYNTDNKQSMILPTQISFTLDGISGLVIGNLFSINKDFIPKSYKTSKKELGYIITKIGHQIQNNDWVTNIDGYPFIPSDEGVAVSNPTDFNLVITYEPLTGNVYADVTTAKLITKSQINNNILKLYNTFKLWGLTKEQSAGIIGNAYKESTLNPTAKTIDSNGLLSGGLFQWNGPRYDALVKKYGDNWVDINNQLSYLKDELYGPYKKVLNNIKKIQGTPKYVLEQSTYIWASEFEVCKECVKGINAEIQTRIKFANQALEVINNPEKYYNKNVITSS